MRALFRPKKFYKQIFFVTNSIGSETLMAWILKLPNSSSQYKVSEGTRDFDGPCNYLYSFRKQPATSFFININRCFHEQGNVGHHANKST